MAVQETHEQASSPPVRITRITAWLPIVVEWTSRYRLDGRVIDVDHVWTTAARWCRLDERACARWTVERIGPFVLAERIRS